MEKSGRQRKRRECGRDRKKEIEKGRWISRDKVKFEKQRDG